MTLAPANDLPSPTRNLLQGPLPLALLLMVVAAFRWESAERIFDLRFIYALGLLPILGAYRYLVARQRRGSWLGLIITAFIAFEFLVMPLNLYRVPFLNRFEHFTALALLAAVVFDVGRLVGGPPSSRRVLLALALVPWGIGWVNELLEYTYRRGTPFFSDDTLLDLAMNTAAIALVTLWQWPLRRSDAV